MSPRSKRFLKNAAECERLSRSVLDNDAKLIYADLVEQWHDLAHEAENLDREHYRWLIDPHQ
jgi:hypothetical protein